MIRCIQQCVCVCVCVCALSMVPAAGQFPLYMRRTKRRKRNRKKGKKKKKPKKRKKKRRKRRTQAVYSVVCVFASKDTEPSFTLASIKAPVGPALILGGLELSGVLGVLVSGGVASATLAGSRGETGAVEAASDVVAGVPTLLRLRLILLSSSIKRSMAAFCRPVLVRRRTASCVLIVSTNWRHSSPSRSFKSLSIAG